MTAEIQANGQTKEAETLQRKRSSPDFKFLSPSLMRVAGGALAVFGLVGGFVTDQVPVRVQISQPMWALPVMTGLFIAAVAEVRTLRLKYEDNESYFDGRQIWLSILLGTLSGAAFLWFTL